MILPGHDPLWHSVFGCGLLEYASSPDGVIDVRSVKIIEPGFTTRITLSAHLLTCPIVKAMQPASVDIRLGDRFIIQGYERTLPAYTLMPGEFILASTMETVDIPIDYAGRIEGKSSRGREGLLVHVTAGFLDPGFKGIITLEMMNVSHEARVLRAGEYIAQVALQRMLYPARPYAGRYQGATGPEASKAVVA